MSAASMHLVFRRTLQCALVRPWRFAYSLLIVALSAQAQQLAPNQQRMVLAAAQQLVQGYNARDEATVLRLIDMRALGARTAATMFDRATDRLGFERGFADGGKRLIATQFASLERAHGHVKFMHLTPRPGYVGALARFDLGDSGFDYVEWRMERDAQGSYRAVDWDSLMNGELFSVTLGALTKLLVDPNPNVLKKLLGITQPNDALLQKFKEIGDRNRAGDARGALSLVEQLPRELGDSWVISKLRVTLAAQGGDDAAYRRQLASLAKLHGNNPRAALLLIDHHFYNGDFAQVLRSVDVLEKRVGVDGLTRLLRANAYLSLREFDQATMQARASIELEQDLEAPYWALASAHIGKQRFGDAIATYKQLMTNFSYAFKRADFADKAEFADLIKSKEFKAWLPK